MNRRQFMTAIAAAAATVAAGYLPSLAPAAAEAERTLSLDLSMAFGTCDDCCCVAPESALVDVVVTGTGLGDGVYRGVIADGEFGCTLHKDSAA